MTDKPDSRSPKRAEQHGAMLKEALRRPGVREVMRVYGAWEQADRGLDAHRIASRRAEHFTTTDHTNARTR